MEREGDGVEMERGKGRKGGEGGEGRKGKGGKVGRGGREGKEKGAEGKSTFEGLVMETHPTLFFSCKFLTQVKFLASGSQSGFTISVKPQVRTLTSKDGTMLMRRWQLPLCGGHCIKYGLSLGTTIPDKVYLDLTRTKFGVPYRFMGLTRTGDPRKLFIDADAPISSDMFKVHDDLLAWYDSPDWKGLEVEEDPSQRRVQGLLNAAQVIAGTAVRDDVKARFFKKLCF